MRQLWPIADQLAAAFGTRIGRASRLWRLPARVLWWVSLLAARDGVAVLGNAALTVTWTSSARTRAFRWLLWPLTLASAAVLLYAAPGLWRSRSVMVVLCLLVVGAVIIEFASAFVRAARRGSATQRALAQLRTTWSGPVAQVAMFVGSGDGGRLARAWLRHVDEVGLALVADARTPRLARVYCRAGFRPVAGDPTSLYRLPASARAAGDTNRSTAG